MVLGDEDHTPYDRPPLTKQFLAGDWEVDRLALPGSADASLGLELEPGRAAVALDAATRRVTLDDGSTIDADGVVLACGTSARRLPGAAPMAGVLTLRTLDDATALRGALAADPARVVVVGAGFIGAEVAATCRQRGVAVTMVEPLEVPLARVVGSTIGEVFAEIHRDEGVDLRLGVGVDRLEADAAGQVRRVHLTDGTAVEATVVVVGIGVVPNTGWLEGSGLTIDDGIVCDVRPRPHRGSSPRATSRAGPTRSSMTR